MPLTLHEKTDLSNNQTKIEQKFNEYTGIKNYMAVYFNKVGCTPYLTFKSTNGFPPTNILGRNIYLLACVYDLSGNFTTQTTNFLTF